MKYIIRMAAVLCAGAVLLFGYSEYSNEEANAAGEPMVSPGAPLERLAISENGRHLVKENGTPFFWLGCTAWAMFQNLDRAGVIQYLDDRKAKGFTVVQSVAFWYPHPHAISHNAANVYGHRPFAGEDIPRMNEPLVMEGGSAENGNDYWDHADFIVQEIRKRNMYLALLPLWGRAFVNGDQGGKQICDTTNAKTYGRFLGERYKDEPHIIWVSGGDASAISETGDHRLAYRKLAEGILKGVTGRDVGWDQSHRAWDQVLMTYHPAGKPLLNSSEWFHRDAWLDFNMIETYTNADKIYEAVNQDYERNDPVRPTVMAEPMYEGQRNPSDLRATPFQVRRQGYQSYLAGACGYTYGAAWDNLGNGPLWGFGNNWEDMLNLPGAQQLTILKKFFANEAWWKWIPDQGLLAGGTGSGENMKVAMRSSEGNEIIIYFADNTPADIRLEKISHAKEVTANWFNPANGLTQDAGRYTVVSPVRFTPPNGWEDAVLICRSQTKE